MSSSNGKSFTGTALVVLAMFGIGGAVVDKMRSPEGEVKPDEIRQTMPKKETVKSEFAKQKPGFEIVNLSRDGTGTLEGKAAAGANIVLLVDGKAEKVGVVGKDGNFSLSLDKSLADGKHILKVKTVGPKNKEPVASDHSIEVTVADGREAVVALLEKGKPRQVLQGVEDKVAAPVDPVKKEEKPVVKTPKTDDLSAKPTALVPSIDMASQAKDKPVVAAVPVSKPKWRELSFGDLKYVDGEGGAGEVNLAGMAQAGAKIRFLMDGKKIGETMADKTGNWSLKATQELKPGAHWLVAEQLDEKGKLVVKAEAPFDRAEPPAKQVVKKAPEEKPAVAPFDALASMKKAVSSGDTKQKAPVAGNADTKKIAALDAEGKNGNDGDNANIWDRFKGIFKVEPGKKQEGSKPSADKPETGGQKLVQDGASKLFSFGSLTFKNGAEGDSIELTGNAKPGSRVRLFEGSQEIGEVIANNEGFWTFTKKGEMKPGMHLFRAGHVLKSGRITAEARMQYDHVTPTRAAQLRNRGEQSDPSGSDANSTNGAGADTGTKNDIEPSDSLKPSNDMKGAVVASNQKQPETNTMRAPDETDAASSQTGPVASVTKPSVTVGKRRVVRTGRKFRSARKMKKRRARRWSSRSASRRLKIRKRKMRRVRRNIRRTTSTYKRRASTSKRRRLSAIRRSASARSINRYSLGKRNKARYMAKRRMYPHSRKTPVKVRVQKGTTLWGYSEHYYGRGRLYPRIQRANRATIKNPDKIFSGQRIRVPRVKKKKRRHR